MRIGFFIKKKREFIFLLFLVLLFLIINLPTLNSWFYSVIGDEYSFFEFAKNFKITEVKLFSQAGVFGYHPVLSSYYQYIVMRIFGINNFGWRLSSVLVVVFSLPGFYFLVKNLFEKRTAAFASIIFVFSFYFYAYAHTGYNNIQVIFPFVYSLFFLTEAQKKFNYFLFFLSGVFCGLGWYTFYSSRIVYPLCLLYLLLFLVFNHELKKKVFLSFGFLTLGFLLSVMPLFLSDGMNVFRQMKNQSVLNPEYIGIYVDDPLKRFLANFKMNLIAFFFGEKEKHFLIAPLFDRLTQIFVFLGFLVIIKQRTAKNVFVFFAYILSIIMVAFNPIYEIVVSRLQISLLILIIIAGVGWKFIDHFIEVRKKVFLLPLNFFFFFLLLFLNLGISYFVIPQKYSIITKESLIVKAVQESKYPVVINEGKIENFLFREVMEAYKLEEKTNFINDKYHTLPVPPYLFLDNNKEDNQVSKESIIFPCQNGEKLSISGFRPQDVIEGIICH